MSSKPAKTPPKQSKTRKFAFQLISISIPFIFILFIELVLRIAGYGDNYNLFIDFPGKEKVEHRVVNPEIGKKYFHKVEYTKPAHDMFLKKKPENGFRIFVMGSSTVVGFPYDENLMFSRILQERLQDSYPERQIEVVNTAITAINSFTLLDYIDDILKEEPDAILIYAGHNEFYGAFGVGSVEKSFASRGISILNMKLLNFKFYQLLRNSISNIGDKFSQKANSYGQEGTLMKIIVDNKEIGYQSELYKKGIANFRKNLDEILQHAQRKKIPVFVSEVVSNIKDLTPFSSVTTSDYPKAIDVYTKAKQLEKDGDFASAKENYTLAKDLDCIRFRASEEINDVVHDLASKYGNYLVPMKESFFEQASPNHLIGNNLLTEHVHPNIDGYFLMADAFFYKIAESKLVGDKLNMLYYKDSNYYKNNYGYTTLDSLVGVHRVNSLKYHWPFQPYDAPMVLYRELYKPKSTIDSLAFEAFRSDEFKVFMAHEKMGKIYEAKDDFYNASKEYCAAIQCNPFVISDYMDAANCLIKNNDFHLAFEPLEKSLAIEKTFFAYFKMGEILLNKGEYADAANAFKNSMEYDYKKEFSQLVLLKLHESYFYLKDDKSATETLQKLHALNPGYTANYPEINNDRIHYQLPIQVKNHIESALLAYKNGDYETALNLLKISLEIKETALANKVLGDIYIMKKDRKSIVYYLKAYSDYKNDLGFLYNLGILYLQNKQVEKAKETLDAMKAINGSDDRTIALGKSIR